MERQIAVGRVAGAHGIRGEVLIVRFGDEQSVLDPGSTLRLERGGQELAVLTVEAARPHKNAWIVTFTGVETRNEAEALRGATLTVGEHTLPPLDEGTYYRYQLIGLAVTASDGEDLGRVREVLETGAHDLLSVKGPRGEVLIPAVEPFVRSVDLAAGRITVDLPEGLVAESGPAGDGRRSGRGGKAGESGDGDPR